MAPPTLVFTTEASRLPACWNRHHFEPIYAVNIGLKKKRQAQHREISRGKLTWISNEKVTNRRQI
jgi:hypothetical protein